MSNWPSGSPTAFELGDVDALQSLLAADVVLQGDGGGKGPQYGTGIVGARNVARTFVSSIPPFLQIGGVVEQRAVNGQPGAVFRDPGGNVVGVIALDILDGQIQAIRGVSTPTSSGTWVRSATPGRSAAGGTRPAAPPGIETSTARCRVVRGDVAHEGVVHRGRRIEATALTLR